MLRFRTFDVRSKLIALSLVSLASMAVVLLIFMQSAGRELYQAQKTQLQELIKSLNGAVSHFHHLEQSGELDRSAAQRLALDMLYDARYNSFGYFWVNDISGKMLMHPFSPELVNQNTLDIIGADGTYPFREFISQAQKGGGWTDYFWPKPNGTVPGRKTSYVSLFSPWGWVIGTGLYEDEITSKIKSKTVEMAVIVTATYLFLATISLVLTRRFLKQLEWVAAYDRLTGLLTRHYLFDVIPFRLADHDRNPQMVFAVMYFDLDHFKHLNDEFGHSFGDQVLIGVAETIKAIVRKGDLAVRFGGEEMLVIMLAKNQEEVVNVAYRIRAETNKQDFRVGDKEIHISISGGIAFREPGEEFDAVIKRADKKLYAAKENGRDRLVV